MNSSLQSGVGNGGRFRAFACSRISGENCGSQKWTNFFSTGAMRSNQPCGSIVSRALRTASNKLSDCAAATGVVSVDSKGINLDFKHLPTLEELEGHYLHILLDKFSGHRGKVARALGISERNVYRLLKKNEFMET